MVNKKNLLKEKIKRKLKRKIDFRHLRYFKQRYPPIIPNILGAGMTTDDAYYLGEEWFKRAGSVIGIKPKENPQLKTIEWLEHKTHHTHSGFKKTTNFIKKFEKVSFIDTPTPVLKKRVWNLIHKN
jgi:hypothetical protein